MASQYTQENTAIANGLKAGTMTQAQADSLFASRKASWQENGPGKGNTLTTTQLNNLNTGVANANKTLGIG